MKTNVGVTLDDRARNDLARLVDGKMTGRKITRKEIAKLARDFIDELVKHQRLLDKLDSLPPAPMEDELVSDPDSMESDT